ncbi:NAD(P)-dependent oxidoreductase [Streptomyces sp. IBSBF 2435]|uniref:NAD(P)-dependent oxidoreductase n=1 Tax=Streptomyces sp. IBSBF 2435 TaxID=2903531 RepID=UPI002FDBFD75
MGGIVVFGAGGRAGRAVTAEARARGHEVTAVVRDTGRHAGITADGVQLAGGDITDPAAVAAAGRGRFAAVHAVSPFTGPEQGFADLDPDFFVKAADALLLGLAETGVARLVVVGLFANLRTREGGLVMDDPAAFPPRIRPFAAAHQAGLDRLRAAQTSVDWLVLTPPALLAADAPRTGRYRIGGETVPDAGPAHLSYADLAVAALDEIEAPRHHRTRVSVLD